MCLFQPPHHPFLRQSSFLSYLGAEAQSSQLPPSSLLLSLSLFGLSQGSFFLSLSHRHAVRHTFYTCFTLAPESASYLMSHRLNYDRTPFSLVFSSPLTLLPRPFLFRRFAGIYRSSANTPMPSLIYNRDYNALYEIDIAMGKRA